MHGVGTRSWNSFVPDKYELIHLTKARKQQTSRGIQLGTVHKAPAKEVRVLGLFFDPRPSWKAHSRKVEGKMITQENALHKLTGSTWGLPLIQARQVYIMVVRPAVTYSAGIWHNPAVK